MGSSSTEGRSEIVARTSSRLPCSSAVIDSLELGELVARMQLEELLKSLDGFVPVILLQMLNLELQHLPVWRPPAVELLADFKHLFVQAQVVSACNKLTGIEHRDVFVK